MRIGFQFFGGSEWQAGNSFLTDSFQALQALGPAKPGLALVSSANDKPESYSAFLPSVDEVISLPGRARTERREALLIRVRDLAAVIRSKLLKAYQKAPISSGLETKVNRGLDCLFAIASGPIPSLDVPRISWIFDFQHLHVPELFSSQDRAARDGAFRYHAQAATLVLLKSETIRRDFEVFAPELSAKARVVRFVAHIPQDVFSTDPAKLAARYHLPEKFVLVPNQFWKHKNHMQIVKALAILRERSVEPVVVCTGHLFDPRDPAYLGEVLHQASLLGVRNQLIVLGMLPRREDVLGLIRQSASVLNPSRFEGFGYTAAESLCLGKRALLSDLPAHREQQHPQAEYFDPQDAEDLADKLEKVWRTTSPGPDAEWEPAARAVYPARQREFGTRLLELAREAIALRPARA